MKTLRTILVPVDFSVGSRTALQQASRIATHTGATITVVHVIDPAALANMAEYRGASLEDQTAASVQGAELALDEWIRLSDVPLPRLTTILIDSPAHGILGLAQSLKPELVVAGVQGAGQTVSSPGSVACKLARKLDCDLLLVRPDHPGAFHKVLACIDLGDNAPLVAKKAVAMAQMDGVPVVFGHVVFQDWMSTPYWDIPTPLPFLDSSSWRQKNMQRQLDGISRESDTFEVLLTAGSCSSGLTQIAERSEADLVVLGARSGLSLAYALLGSTAEHVLTRLPRSLLVVRPEAAE